MRTPRNENVATQPPSRLREGSGEGRTGSAPDSAIPSSNPSHKREGDGPERTCILTRATGSRADLIRLALAPDASVHPDVRARAPGRGAWIGVGRAELDAANAKGKLKAALGRAFKTQAVSVPADLGERIEAALRQHALDRLGMEARSGKLINGADKIETAARAGKVHLLIHAADSGEDGRRKLDQSWRVGGGEAQGLIFPEPRTILSMALGRDNVVHVALTDAPAATRVRHALTRWRDFCDPDRGPEGGSTAPSGRGSTDAVVKE